MAKKKIECWNKGGYTVCEGSKGQKGVYKAKNPRGPQDIEGNKKKADKKAKDISNRKKERASRQKPGGIYGDYKDPVPENAPNTDRMRKRLVDGGARASSLEGQGKRYVYDRYISETTQGKDFKKRIKPKDNRDGRLVFNKKVKQKTGDGKVPMKDMMDWLSGKETTYDPRRYGMNRSELREEIISTPGGKKVLKDMDLLAKENKFIPAKSKEEKKKARDRREKRDDREDKKKKKS